MYRRKPGILAQLMSPVWEFLCFTGRGRERSCVVVIPYEEFKIPKPLKRRKRALSFILQTKTDEGGKPVTEARLLNIPFELRKQIWTECLIGSEFYLNIHDGRLCQSWTKMQLIIRNGRRLLSQVPVDSPSKTGLFSLALTCRQLYLETINLPFSVNETRISYNCLLYLDRVLLPQRMNAIRNLHLTFYASQLPPLFGDSRADWTALWRNIVSLSGLRGLWIEIVVSAQFEHEWAAYCRNGDLFEVAKLVVQPEIFDFRLLWDDSHPAQAPRPFSSIVSRGERKQVEA